MAILGVNGNWSILKFRSYYFTESWRLRLWL